MKGLEEERRAENKPARKTAALLISQSTKRKLQDWFRVVISCCVGALSMSSSVFPANLLDRLKVGLARTTKNKTN